MPRTSTGGSRTRGLGRRRLGAVLSLTVTAVALSAVLTAPPTPSAPAPAPVAGPAAVPVAGPAAGPGPSATARPPSPAAAGDHGTQATTGHPTGPAPGDPSAPAASTAPAAPAEAPTAHPGGGTAAATRATPPSSGTTPAPGPAPGAPATRTPAAPSPGVVSGTLVRVWAEVLADHEDEDENAHEGARATHLQAWVETSTTAYPVDAAAVTDVEDGSDVTLDLAAAAAGAPHPVRRVVQARPPVAAAGELLYGEGSADVLGVAAAGVVHDVTVVLATPAGAARDGMTSATVAASVSGGVHTFWSGQSRGQRGFRVAARHEWQSLTSSCSNAFALWDEVAAKVGFVTGPRKHLLVYIPPAAGCGAGLGTVGSPDAGGRSWVGYASTSIIAHELGHNLGLGHSNGLLCTDRPDGLFAAGTWQSGCAAHEYRDYYDVMGVSWGSLGSLAAPQADALGLVLSTEKLVVSAPVRARLAPTGSEGLRVLRVDEPGGTYYVEYRVAAGQDSWLSGNSRGLDAGVLVHRRSPVKAKEVLLLDGSVTAGTRTDDWRSALPVGGSLTTASGSTRFEVEEAGPTGATVVVHRDGVGPVSVEPPADGSQVEIQSPTAASTSGATVFAGVATAPEGTLLWEVLQDGVVRGSGFAQTGANGTFAAFQVPVALPAGTVTFRVRVPDDSDGERVLDPRLLVDELTLQVS